MFDKTGTITEGRFSVLEGLSELAPQHRAILKALTACSNHPISKAIYFSIDEEAAPMQLIEEFTGKGLRGIVDDETYYLGSRDLLSHIHAELPQEAHFKTLVSTVFFATSQKFLGSIHLGDCVRQGAKEAVDSLRSVKTLLLSGDAQLPVTETAKACGFVHYHWGCNPLQKKEYIEECRNKGEIVCMLGDGINDAPALTAAHIGISVVSATDVSIQVSDILLTTERLQVIPKMRDLAAKGRAILKQNLFWAFIYNVVGIGLAAFGWLSPIFAAAAMVASSLMVLFNAKRVH